LSRCGFGWKMTRGVVWKGLASFRFSVSWKGKERDGYAGFVWGWKKGQRRGNLSDLAAAADVVQLGGGGEGLCLSVVEGRKIQTMPISLLWQLG